jgi:hypothetical protein
VPRRVVELLVAVAVIAAVVVLWPRSHEQPPPFYADAVRTPGVLNADVTGATIRTTICVRGWTRTVRPSTSYTDALKRRQMVEYGARGSPHDYQEDHLISLELGGDPVDPRNLWPQPRPWAERVDRTENELNDAVCSGRVSLAEAQLQESALKHGEDG